MVLARALAALLLLVAAFAPAAAAAPLEAYARLPAVERAALSHSGSRFVLVEVVDGARRLVARDSDDLSAKPLLILELGSEKVRAIDWAGEDLILLWTSVTTNLGMEFGVSRHEIMRVSVASVSRRNRSELFRSSNLFRGVFGSHGVVQRDGRWYGHFKGIELERGMGSPERRLPGRNPDLLRVDLATGVARRVAAGSADQGWRDWAVSGDGQVAATLDFRSNDGRWRLRSGASGKVIASGVNPLGDIDLVGRGREPGTILYLVRDRRGEDHWIEADAGDGSAVELFAGEDVIDIWVDPASRLVIGYTRAGGGREERFFGETRELRARAARAAFAGRNVAIKSHDGGFDRLIVHSTGPHDSGSWWLVHPATGALRRIGSSYPGVAPEDVGPVRTVDWRAADGLAIEGVLTLPPGAPPLGLALVVLPHGGPRARDYPLFDWWAQAFASRGYAVLQPNFRGSTGYGTAFRQAGRREWGRKMQSDISDGIAMLAARGIVDRRRVCIMGGSYGGYAALAGVTLQQGFYRCALSFAGVSDLPRLLQHDRLASGGSQTVARAWRADIGDSADLAAVSPARHAARADAPILLIHGRDDTVVPIAQSRIMARQLRRAGKPVELIELPGEDHWLSREATRKAMLLAAVRFVERHNPAR